jgi:hypothetical protein
MGKTVANFMIERPRLWGVRGIHRVFYQPARPTHATRARWRGDPATVHGYDELAA